MTLSKVNPNFVSQNLGRRNLIINGDAQINQKGNQSGVGDAGYIGPDRWLSFINTSSTLTFSQETQTIGHTDNNPDSKYNFKFDWLGTGASTIKTIAQRIEGVHHGNGRKMTLSFWAKTEQADDGIIRIIQSFGSGGSPSAGVVIDSSSIDFQNSWTYHTYTWDMPSTSGKTLGTDNNDHIEVQFRFTGTLNSYFQFTDVQVEVGDTATSYERRSYGEELSLCQRYFFNILGGSTSQFPVNFGNVVSTGNNGHITFTVPLPQPMRADPTLTHDLANSNHLAVNPGATQWSFYYQNQGWGGKAGNGDLNTLSRAMNGKSSVTLGTYYISPGNTVSDQLYVGGSRKMWLSAEL